MQKKILLFTYFREETTRTTFLTHLAQAVPALALSPTYLSTEQVQIPGTEPERRAVEIVAKSLEDAPLTVGVLLSDSLVAGQRVPMPTAFARDCAARFSGDRLGTVAIMLRPQRVEDIDRTL